MIIFKNKHYHSFVLNLNMSKSISTYFKKLSLSKLPKVHWKIVFYSIFKHFQVILNSSFLITLSSFIRKILIPFDFNTKKNFLPMFFSRYQYFQAGFATDSEK